ncbi:alpha-L-fucosidase [Paenibacillus agaridevorans]|uniref:alpha-L-fucosidase n=1 Tax=Paenibacillus agaridevorans TaxID=171404 RepID=A0A2R5F043_9BACL|nr:alpha-L-fucosidase [Paenibacillus agaridevorans]GBG08954.1 alpha-L-fucosidase [Paenibacillus agaridevorans]
MMHEVPQPLPYIRSFENMAFGMFIHWGLYSALGQGEWVMDAQKIPSSEYAKLADSFTAKDFDARRIAELARDAGMKYIVLTMRHHDGFSLYDTSGLGEYDSVHSLAGRDLAHEFVEGCREFGIMPFFYHTTLDWHREEYVTDFPAYLRYLRASIERLCTRYGPIGGFWFDGNWDKPDADWEEGALYELIRKHQPNAIIVNNSGLGAQGAYGHPEIDCVTFEQGRPSAMDRRGMPKYVAGEMCQTINSHWGVGLRDFNYKSLGQLIEFFCSCRKVGANYLLNIGLQGDGAVGAMEYGLLRAIGNWSAIHEEALYETRPTSISGGEQDFALENSAGKLYFFVHRLAIAGSSHVVAGGNFTGPRSFEGVGKAITGVRWLDNQEEVPFVHDRQSGLFCLQASGYPYGTDLVVRVAVAETKE